MNRNLFFALLMVVQAASPVPRNPFQPQLSPCDALFKQLARWTLHGVVSSEKGAIAIMHDPQKNWHRITRGMLIEHEAQILEINQQFLSVALPAKCGQTLYSWKIEGQKYGMDARVRSADSVAVSKPRG